ncbi:telomerase reverse transcriptase [Ophiostoma piceae UAMH 11346]|uniref:Telomerase reverse transcriptase n=1 Tax=Ophiostoma piceae (strain UAMH 11346) TaxID=1262450 RepID=S3BWX7_OPHP1|nr:telomerase reverse transcriptase [Ophiostoma piceae UAMH 11346]
MAHTATRKRKPSSRGGAAKTEVSSKRARLDVGAGTSMHQHQEQPASVPASTPPLPSQQGSAIKQDLLTLYYPCVKSLRDYLLSRLPPSSRIRRKRLASFGKNTKNSEGGQAQPQEALEELLTRTLDTTLVAYTDIPFNDGDGETRRGPDLQQLRVTFSQSKKVDESNVTISDAPSGPFSLQAETVDFVPMDQANKSATKVDTAPPCTIPGLFVSRRPQNAQCLKELPWPQLLALLGASGVQIMTDLLMHCSLFIAVDSGLGNYLQVTGKPLYSLRYPSSGQKPEQPSTTIEEEKPTEKQPSDITLVRSRTLYAKPSVTAGGTVLFGLNHIYALNRFPYHKKLPHPASGEGTMTDLNKQGNIHIAMYIFPRQFGLHNVYTSSVDRSQTSQKFLDYTLREAEIYEKFGPFHKNPDIKVPVPKRLRGEPMALIERLRARHAKCAYSALLQVYCPVDGPKGNDGFGKDPGPLVDLAVPLAQVSAFCQAVIQKVFPGEFWGSGDIRTHNKTTILQRVDTFIRLLRYEAQSLHGLMQGLKISEIEWLAPPGLQGNKMSNTDLHKRQEIFAEFVYYLFDSFLIPLIRSNFYVTESNTHRNRLFYFRHDVWRRITEPALASIKTNRFEEVKTKDALRIIDSRRLGCAQIRLLPKNTSVRTIMNLSRRAMEKNGTRLLPSTNTVLEPVAAMFNHEMKQHPHRLGSSMLSMQSIYKRLVDFRARFSCKKQPAFYFAKVDVMSAFDTIPQDAMVELISNIPSHEVYHIGKHSEVTAPTNGKRPGAVQASHNTGIPERRWRSVAKAGNDTSTFHDSVDASYAVSKKNTVFVDTAYRNTRGADELVGLAAHHVKEHIVKIGKKYFRQKQGIPQGSVLSSTLCSYFYADLEKAELSFLDPEKGTGANDCLLLRLIDDFLLITTDKAKAARFVEVMHRGHPRYGVQVNPSKSLVNFDLEINSQRVPRRALGAPFPYCGLYINVSNLNLTKDRETKKHVVFDSLTVDRTRSPGEKFKRKTLSHTMFYDMSYNSRRTALHNLHSALVETANRMWAYARCMTKAQRPSPKLTISTIEDLAGLAFAILSGQNQSSRGPDYKFTVTKVHLKLILLHAFFKVLNRKQTSYKEVLAWIQNETRTLKEVHRPRLPKEFTE